MLYFIISILLLLVTFSIKASDYQVISGLVLSKDIENFSSMKINVVSFENESSIIYNIQVNADGTFMFRMYWQKCKLDFDLSSLPDWYGVTRKSIIIDNEIDDPVYFEIDKVDHFDAKLVDGLTNNMFYSKDDRLLFLNHESRVQYNYLDKSIEEILVERKLSYKITTTTSFNTFEKNDYIFFDEFDNQTIINKLNQYKITNNEIVDRSGSLSDYVFDSPTTYYSGNFCIIYEGDLNAPNHLTNSQLTLLVNQLTDIEVYFSDFGFLLPRTINNYLYVYCVYSSLQQAGEYNLGTKALYLNYNNEFNDLSTLVHEYFHGIQHSYQYVPSTNFRESTAVFASLSYYIDNNIPISDSEKSFYSAYISGSGGSLFSGVKPGMYKLFPFFYYISTQYCNSNGLLYLKNYFSSLSSNIYNIQLDLSNFLYLIDSSLDIYDVLINYINVSYPSCRISPLLDDLMDFGVYDEDILADTLDGKNYYEEIVLPANGYYIVSVHPSERTCGRLTLSFENIQNGLNVNVVTRTNSSIYTTETLSTGNDGSKNCVINNLTGCDIKISGDVQNVYIYISNFTSTSKSLYINYSIDYVAHDNAIYRIKNFGSGYYMTYNDNMGNIYQDEFIFNSNYEYQYYLFKKQNNKYLIATITSSAPTTPLKFVSINALNCDTNVNLNYSSTPSTYYDFRVQFSQLGYNRITYGEDGYSVASYNYYIGSNPDNLITSNGNICLYYDPIMILSFWEFY